MVTSEMSLFRKASSNLLFFVVLTVLVRIQWSLFVINLAGFCYDSDDQYEKLVICGMAHFTMLFVIVVDVIGFFSFISDLYVLYKEFR